MKINDVNRVGSVNPYRSQQAAGSAAHVGKKSAKDEVQFSEEALKLLESQEAAAVDPARAAKLNELKEAVTAGTYKVDAHKVAEKMLEFFRRS